ncbi:MAG TPA: hypothetical protein VGQ22_23685 [Steroidobacteraceae bacterium]|jgi:hypothetical protein|nr:hypothetical protein [Steroidobacteraceae bacterium]
MSAGFTFRALPETAYTRKARLIVEIRDPVTLEPVWDGLTLRATGLMAEPIVSSSSRFVWFEDQGATPLELSIDPGRLPYLPQILPVPPLPAPPPPPAKPQTWNAMLIELAPTTAYPFAGGTTVLRGSIIRNVADDPLVSLAGVDVRLQWIDDNAAGTQWVSAPNLARTSASGDFAAIARLAPNQIARADAQHRMRVRVAATRAGTTLFSPERQIPFGQVSDAQQSFAWDDLQP